MGARKNGIRGHPGSCSGFERFGRGSLAERGQCLRQTLSELTLLCRFVAIGIFVGLAFVVACGGGEQSADVPPGVEVEAARDVTFAVGPHAPPAPSDAEEPAEFVYRDLVYYVAVSWALATPSGQSPCEVDGRSAAHGFGVRINDATGEAYPGPITIRVEAIPTDAAAFVAVGETCASTVQYDQWPGGQLAGTVSLGAEELEDLQGVGAIGLKVALHVPGSNPITVIPGEGSQSERRDDFAHSDETPPRHGDHWHAAYGIFVCDRYLPPLADGGTDRVGIHTHDDGLVHIHPFSSEAAGANATLGVFTDQIDLRLADDSLGLPDGTTYRNGADCGGESSRVRVLVWDGLKDTDPEEVRTPFAELPFASDGMVLAIAFAPPDRNIPLPPSARDLAHPSDVP